MDGSDPEIEFDAHGICSHCHAWEGRERQRHVGGFPQLAETLKRAGRGRAYDCVIGVSGGVDSSYALTLLRDHGLRVLAVHFDNGWNSELAVENIQRLVEAHDCDLETYVVDWAEFRDIQRSFLRASVIDFELPTDNAIFATIIRSARQNGVKYVIEGTNAATEHGLPRAWSWMKLDWRNIRAIHQAFGSLPLRTFPHIGPVRWGMARLGLGLRVMRPLNLIEYSRDAAVDALAARLGWRSYGGKHHESLVTKFYQGYILPKKFGVDKRRAHLSAQIRNGEITRDRAQAELDEPAYSPEELARERTYVLKKLGFDEAEFHEIMARPPRPHSDFASDAWWVDRFRTMVKPLRL